MAECLIGLGSNLGDRTAHLEQACRVLCGHPQIHNCLRSALHATTPVGGPAGQGVYLNAALRLTTSLSPRQLLAIVHDVEQQLGRQRRERWGPRTIDMDILLYDQLVMETDRLVLPHPRMAIRRFVLEPACEVAADMIHPPTGWPVARLLERLGEPPQYVAIAGLDATQTADLAIRSARDSGAHLLLDPGSPAQDGAPAQAGTVSADHELRAVDARREQLSALAAGRYGPAGRWHVCGYWLPQSLAVARGVLAGRERRRVERACARAMLRMPLPQCIVFLAERPRGVHRSHDAENGAESHAAARGSAAGPMRELARQLSQTGQGPVLRIPGGDLQCAATELAAAIDAMR